MQTHFKHLLLSVAFLVAISDPAFGGMPAVLPEDLKTVFRVSETPHQRLTAISFFLLGLAMSAALVRFLWNSLAADFKSLPRLTFAKSLALVTLWGLLFIIVLTMISGARELMTPGAWQKQGLTYTLDEATQEPSPTAGLSDPGAIESPEGDQP